MRHARKGKRSYVRMGEREKGEGQSSTGHLSKMGQKHIFECTDGTSGAGV